MADVRHRNIAEGEKHEPKNFGSAPAYSILSKDENSTSRYIKTQLLEPVLNIVDGNATAPSTPTIGDIYLLKDEGNGTVDASWDSVAYNDLARFNGVEWIGITPTEGNLTYDKTGNKFYLFVTSWTLFVPEVPTLYNQNGSIPSATNREVTIPSDSSVAFKGKTIISDIATPTVDASAIFNIESTTKGLLIPRVTNAQMTSISSPADNLLVFNTQQSALYRYDLATTSWVALSAGYGIVELTGTTGVPKYYASIKSAHDDATAGQKITLHSNYTETTTNEIILKGVVIDLNEYTYTYDVADDSDVFSAFNTTAGVSHAIVNGKVIKRNGTGTNLILNANKTGDYFKLTGVDFLNEDGGCFDVNGEINGSGSKFVATASGTGCFMGASSAKVKGGYYGNLGAGGNRCSGEAINTEWEAVSGIGCYLLGKASSSVFRSGSNDGLLASGAEIINCEAYSDTGVAADITNNTKAYNLYGESNSNVGIDAEGADLIENCKGVSKSGNKRGIKSADLNINCIAESYGTGSVWLVGSNCELIGCTSISKGASNGYSVNGTGVSIINCKALLSDTGKAGVLYNNRDVYVVNLTVKGSATAENKGTGVNLWTDALDSQGITAIE